jgi:hypothetical protein
MNTISKLMIAGALSVAASVAPPPSGALAGPIGVAASAGAVSLPAQVEKVYYYGRYCAPRRHHVHHVWPRYYYPRYSYYYPYYRSYYRSYYPYYGYGWGGGGLGLNIGLGGLGFGWW